MIYRNGNNNKTSRSGRIYENTCNGCSKLEASSDREGRIIYKCKDYPAMTNMVRCIYYRKTQTELEIHQNN